MVWDRYKKMHHLTHNGWVQGSFWGLGDTEDKVAAPDDRVETWEENMRQESGWSKEHVTWECVWVSPNHTEEERKELHKRFPKDLKDKEI